MTAGGKRKAGRPVGSTKDDTRTELLAIRLNHAQRKKSERIGGGNASEGLRKALDAFVEG